jgi:hypothetical protein
MHHAWLVAVHISMRPALAHTSPSCQPTPLEYLLGVHLNGTVIWLHDGVERSVDRPVRCQGTSAHQHLGTRGSLSTASRALLVTRLYTVCVLKVRSAHKQVTAVQARGLSAIPAVSARSLCLVILFCSALKSLSPAQRRVWAAALTRNPGTCQPPLQV